MNFKEMFWYVKLLLYDLGSTQIQIKKSNVMSKYKWL